MKIIDSHQHVFWHLRNDKELVADMDANDIELAWLLTWEIPSFEDSPSYHWVLNSRNIRPDGTHAGITLDDILATRDKFPNRFIAGYCPHPCVGDAPALLRSAAVMHDIKVCGEWKFRVLFDDPRCIRLFRTAGELGMPVVLHLDVPFMATEDGGEKFDPLWYGGTVENLERTLRACPETNFVGHAPGFWREISGDADKATHNYPKTKVAPGGELYRLFDENSNLYADLSAGSALYALKRDPEHAVTFLERFSDRLLFGRDYYGGELQGFLGSLNLSEEATQRIFCKNAESLVAGSKVAEKPPYRQIFK